MNAPTPILAAQTRRSLRWTPTGFQLAVAMTILALVLRVTGLSSRPLWLDEAYSQWFSARSWVYLWTVVPTYEPHPPFYYSILKLWTGLAGSEPAALRSLSVLFAAATVPVVVELAKELERQCPSRRPLLTIGGAAFLAAASPMLVMLSQEARPYALLILAYSVGCLAAMRLLREWGAQSSGSWPSWLLLGASAEVSLWAHGIGALYVACIALALAPAALSRPVHWPRITRGTVTGAMVALAYLPCLLMMLGRTGDWTAGGWLKWDSAMLLLLLPFFSVPVEVLTVASAFAAIALLLLAKRALHSAVSEGGWTSRRALAVLWLGPPVLAATVSAVAVPVFLIRALAPALVPFYVAIASALAHSPQRKERRALSAVLAITLLVPAVQIAWRPAFEPWDEVAAFLRRSVSPSDAVWLYPNDSALPLGAAHAAGFRGIPGDYPATAFKGPIRAGSPAVVSMTPKQAWQLANDTKIRHVPVIWLVTRQSGIFDPAGDLPSALARVRRPGSVSRWGYIEVRPYYRH